MQRHELEKSRLDTGYLKRGQQGDRDSMAQGDETQVDALGLTNFAGVLP